MLGTPIRLPSACAHACVYACKWLRWLARGAALAFALYGTGRQAARPHDPPGLLENIFEPQPKPLVARRNV